VLLYDFFSSDLYSSVAWICFCGLSAGDKLAIESDFGAFGEVYSILQWLVKVKDLQ